MEIKQVSKDVALELMSNKGSYNAIETSSYVVFRMYEDEKQFAIVLDKDKDNYLFVSFSVLETNSYLHLIDFII